MANANGASSQPKQPDMAVLVNATKFTCEECGQVAWAEPSAFMICGGCFDFVRVQWVPLLPESYLTDDADTWANDATGYSYGE